MSVEWQPWTWHRMTALFTLCYSCWFFSAPVKDPHKWPALRSTSLLIFQTHRLSLALNGTCAPLGKVCLHGMHLSRAVTVLSAYSHNQPLWPELTQFISRPAIRNVCRRCPPLPPVILPVPRGKVKDPEKSKQSRKRRPKLKDTR